MPFKSIKFTEELKQKVQDYANKNHNGNFNAAVRELLGKGLNNG